MAYGQNTLPSINAFGDGGLEAAGCGDFGRGRGAEGPVAAGRIAVSQHVAVPVAEFGRGTEGPNGSVVSAVKTLFGSNTAADRPAAGDSRTRPLRPRREATS